MKLKKVLAFTTLAALTIFAFQNCGGGGLPDMTSDSSSVAPGAADSMIQPRAASVAPGESVQFQTSTTTVAKAGTFQLVSGGGGIDSTTGIYTAPASATDAVIMVQDAAGNRSYSFIKVGASLPLVLVPSSASISMGSSLAFAAAGGSVAPPAFRAAIIKNRAGVHVPPQSLN